MCNSRGGGRGFLCPQGTKFAQRTMVCDFEKKVKCNDASDFFHRNLIIHEASLVGNWATSRNNRIKEQKPREFTLIDISSYTARYSRTLEKNFPPFLKYCISANSFRS